MSGLNLLFLCSRNKWRSPTAESIWRREWNVRSAGLSPNARKTVSINDVRWADVIFVMEKKHRQRLLAKFPRALIGKDVVVLDVPDDYQYMDPELVEVLQDKVGAYLDKM